MPNFLQPLDFEGARAELTEAFAKAYKERTGQDYQPLASDDVQSLINCFLYYLGKQIDKCNHTIAQNFLEFSTGPYLDELVKLLGLERRLKEMPTAKMRINAKDSVYLPKNTKFASADGANAFTIEDYHLEKGENIIQVVGDKEGEWQTTILENANPLILKVEMLSRFTNLQDYEEDDALKKRYLMALAGFSTAGSVQSYTHFASVKGVGKIKVVSLNIGEVTIYYTADNLDAPKLIANAIKDKTPLTDKVLIEQASKVPVSLNYTIELKNTLVQKEIIEATKERAFSLFKSLEIGQGVSESKLASLAFVDRVVTDCSVDAINKPAMHEWLFLESVQVDIRTPT
ncbi:baseplate J/gp47 family protein [Helicobacter cynogastricus]|uniref:baseplate J/gp47 family protein n=1 Tax=Helicobacter cynogastricus TaxID=329937 RepID=UPI0013157600|nr:baseplate J/gp47 family protein [Helicobacter cynogastricus]